MDLLNFIASIVLILMPPVMGVVGYYYGLKDGRETFATDKGCKVCGAKYSKD